MVIFPAVAVTGVTNFILLSPVHPICRLVGQLRKVFCAEH